jgi:CubicO group peptidase (beta-lactamase class C family)
MKLWALASSALLAASSCAAPRFTQSSSTPTGQALPATHPNRSLLAELTRDIRSQRYSNIHSLIVIQHGQLIYEEYFAGPDERRGVPLDTRRFSAEELHDVRSVTKSVVSLLFGIAVDAGKVKDLDAPVLDFFPEYADLRAPQRLAIRLRDMLSMTSGLEWDERTAPYGDPRNSERAMDLAPDPYRYVLERPIKSPAGSIFNYSGGDVMVIAAVLERATGMSLRSYADQVLFKPLRMQDYEWLQLPSGRYIAASGLRLRPRDMARIGELYLEEGRSEGKQIVSAGWVRQSLAPQEIIPDRAPYQHYGYYWWLGTARVGQRDVPFSTAVGWGGQRIFIAPTLDTIVVTTAGLYGEPSTRQHDIAFELIRDRVLMAVCGLACTDEPG